MPVPGLPQPTVSMICSRVSSVLRNDNASPPYPPPPSPAHLGQPRQLSRLNTALPASVGSEVVADWPRAGHGADSAAATAAAAINAEIEDILPDVIGFSCLRKADGSGRGPIRSYDVRSECKHVEHRAGLHPLQFRGGVDEPLVPGAAQADQDRDVLLAVDREAHRWCIDTSARVELPALLQCFGVKRHHFAGGLAREDQIGCRENAAQIRVRRFQLARDFAGGYVDRGHAAGDLERLARPAAGPEITRLQLLRSRLLDGD